MANVGLRNVTKIYPAKNGAETTAVHDFSLDIQDREFVVLTGPSGSGKSSVVRMIAGLEEISKGEIFLGDRRMNGVAPKDRDIALVVGNHALYPRMSVYDNLAFPLALRKFSKTEIKKRVTAAAGIVELQQSLESNPDSLSAEERQRAALGRALVRQPKVFLFDEPFANLDATERTRMRVQVKKLRQRLSATIIYATSDPVEAMAMGERIVVLNNGVLEQDGGQALPLGEEAVEAAVVGGGLQGGADVCFAAAGVRRHERRHDVGRPIARTRPSRARPPGPSTPGDARAACSTAAR